ncbi:MAG: hypothetical protein ABSF81_14245 [Bacteroidales bacterium]|jgi:hypothetical protein
MKTRIVPLILLIISFSCGTNHKPLSDAQKEKIKGEVKKVVNTFFKGCEEVNFDMALEPFLDSPDFLYINNGYAFSYKECKDVFRPVFNTFLNQKITIVDEKYAFPDNATVLYSNHCKSLTNYKDGHAILQDPTVMLFIFKKIDDKWKVIYGVESHIDKNVASESSKGLNQAELLMQFVGNFEAPSGKDTSEFVQFKSLQEKNVLSLYAKVVTKGKILLEETGFWGYDAANNKIDLSVIVSNGYVFHYLGEFTSSNKLELSDVNNATGNKFIFERISPDEFKETSIVNNKTATRTAKRTK